MSGLCKLKWNGFPMQYLPIFVLSLFIWGFPGGIQGFWLLGTINNKRKVNRWLNNSFTFWFICRVLYAGKERLMYGCDFVYDTPSGKEANVNNSTNSKTFITYRRARQKMAHSSLAVTEICIIIASKVLKNPELILVLAHGRRNYNHQNFWWLAKHFTTIYLLHLKLES